jgi:uncharacterized protein (TIGR00299 family) protein
MLVGACLDAGVALADLERQLARLPLAGYRLEAAKVKRQGIAGTWFRVVQAGSEHELVAQESVAHAHAHGEHAHAGGGHQHRHLADVVAIIQAAAYEKRLEAAMLDAFEALARAEAKAHDMPVAEVHFHEVGAVDAIVDVCATVLGFDLLGVERIYASEVVVGTGLVRCAHGTLPVPAPGTLELFKGLPIRMGTLPGERATPTGAALLRALVHEFQPALSLRPVGIGYGAGTRDDGPVPNLLRLTMGEVDDPRGQDLVWELSLSVDNVSGEVLGHALGAVMGSGALDVWASASIGKKGRPAHWVVALCDAAQREAVERCLLSELPTLGLRRHRVERRTLPRRVEERDTLFGRVRFKVRTLPDGSEVAQPEADDVERLARERGEPVPLVLARLLRDA